MDGVLNIYKPSGPTSFSMVSSVKRILRIKKAGHIGTLDPLAEGILPICLNKSTRIIQFITFLPKVYIADMRLGVETDTQDATGKTLSTGNAEHIGEKEVVAVLKEFEGEIRQLPPMYSAKKRNGVPLYKLARSGITVEREPVKIRIYSINFMKKAGAVVRFQVHCSAGTYVRTLCHDAGVRLGCGAHMLNLVRTQIGIFDVQNSTTLESLELAQAENSISDKILPMDEVLGFLPEIKIKSGCIKAVSNGAPIPKSSLEMLPEQFQPGTNFRVSSNGFGIIAIIESLTDRASFDRLPPEEIAFKLKRVFT